MRNFEVRMQADIKFNPDSFEIQVGDTVTWVNEDDNNTHSAAADADSPITFTATDLASGEFSKRITFDKEGTVKYRCTHHPGLMTGTITVTK